MKLAEATMKLPELHLNIYRNYSSSFIIHTFMTCNLLVLCITATKGFSLIFLTIFLAFLILEARVCLTTPGNRFHSGSE